MNTRTQGDTANDLLMDCPDDQVMRMKLIWKAATQGDWKDAAAHLRNAEREGATDWHKRCGRLAAQYEAK